MSHFKLCWLLPGLLFGLLAITDGRADEKLSWSQPPFQALEENLGSVLKKHYPDIKLERAKTAAASIRWSHATRKFMIHLPTLTGQWQEATETLGPDRGGIICTAVIREGPHSGMAVVPQTFDRHYFRVLMMAPDREDANAHVVVRLYYPPDVDKAVVSEIAELVQKFDSDR